MKNRTMAYKRYRKYDGVLLPDRKWPGMTITKAPAWCSVDLRDGNQALSVPMNIEEKLRMFELLVSIGFKEIEVGFPSASEVEYQFVRKIIEEQRIPDDVTIQVLTQAREHLIKRTFESVRGAKKVVIHLYNSTSKTQREVVFRKEKEEIKKIAVDTSRLIKALKEENGQGGVMFEYSPESFTGTELDYALDVCSAVINVWGPDKENKMIINLPATVEMSLPNIYADRIEWFCRNIESRDSVIISVHTHNDRGTAVAAAELAVMAGAQRVEGALFGNGERSGNMDIVTMAMNLFSQGVDPELDFSDINRVVDIYRQCTKMDIHPRHPYAGDLVYTAFSGSHQDAINKGLRQQRESKNVIWDVPYLPIDPKDVGRTYEAVIRINSQSGKGGIAYVMETDWGFKMPKAMQPEFAKIIQQRTEQTANELSSQDIRSAFEEEYLNQPECYKISACSVHTKDKKEHETLVTVEIMTGYVKSLVSGKGNCPVDAFVRGIKQKFNSAFDVCFYSEHSLEQGSDAKALAYIGIKDNAGNVVYGAGVDSNIGTASIKAVLSAFNRFKSRR